MFKIEISQVLEPKRDRTTKVNIYLIWFALLSPLLLFTWLAIAVIAHPEGLAWDIPILLAIHSTATPQLDIFASFFTKLGIYGGVVPVMFLVMLVLLLQHKARSLIYTIITTLGAISINYTAKLSFYRPRPHLWDSFYPLPSDYSFPSGHALSSMTLVIVLATLTWGTRWYPWVLIFGSLFVLTIGWTRLYLGVHYPSDILAGWLIALAWGMVVSLWLKSTSPDLGTKNK